MFADSLRQAWQTGSIVDNRAKTCFDWVLPALAMITIPTVVAYFLYLGLRKIKFWIGMGYGVSDCSYGAKEDPTNPGEGSGQGSARAHALQQHRERES